jgi:predicted transcriptional regulator
VVEVKLDPDLEGRLAALAARRGQDKASLATEAIERYLDYDEWFLREVDAGLSEINQGKVLTHEEVGARLDRMVREVQRRA